jgi:hypothetical protein
MVQLSWAAASKGLQNKCFKIKIMNFCTLTDFKLLSQIKGNSVNVFDFLKFIISVRDGSCNNSTQVPKSLEYCSLSRSITIYWCVMSWSLTGFGTLIKTCAQLSKVMHNMFEVMNFNNFGLLVNSFISVLCQLQCSLNRKGSSFAAN